MRHFCYPQRLALVSVAGPAGGYADAPTSSFTGMRHLWNCRAGEIGAEVLLWLRADPALAPHHAEGTPESAALGLVFNKKSSRRSIANFPEQGATKYTIAGRLAPDAVDKTLNDLSVEQDFPVARVIAWRQALLQGNQVLLERFQELLRERLGNLTGDIGKNGQLFFDRSYADWFLAVAEMQCSVRTKSVLWEEELHNDGSASAVLLGLTLYA